MRDKLNTVFEELKITYDDLLRHGENGVRVYEYLERKTKINPLVIIHVPEIRRGRFAKTESKAKRVRQDLIVDRIWKDLLEFTKIIIDIKTQTLDMQTQNKYKQIINDIINEGVIQISHSTISKAQQLVDDGSLSSLSVSSQSSSVGSDASQSSASENEQSTSSSSSSPNPPPPPPPPPPYQPHSRPTSQLDRDDPRNIWW